MNSPIFLQTKLHPTQVASRSLTRTRLLRELTCEPHARVHLVTGPAGSGKSTLLADYLSQQTQSVAWLGLGEEDQDAQVFFSYFLESLCQTFPGSCETTRNLLGSEEIQAAHLCTHLINELFTFNKPVAIVLDDFHLTSSNEVINEFFVLLCKRGPKNLTLILASRELPDLPLPWLRSKRLLTEVHYGSLRFNWEETAELFRTVWGQHLESDLIGILLEKTEGWATGLQLVAQAVRHRSPEEVRSTIESLHGREETIYNYLATEVFESQPEHVRRFLELTSVPDALNPDLARRLAPSLEVAPMLDYLQDARLFVVKLDRDGGWFRYHHLFRDFLRSRLASGHGLEIVERLHRQTAEWLYENDEVVASVPHFLACGDPLRACEILESAGTELLHRGLRASLSRWLESLPSHLRNGRPGLLMVQSELWDLQGDWVRAIEGYRRALNQYRELNDTRRTASVLERLSLCYIKYGETKQLLETCEEGLRLCPADSPDLRSMLQSWMGATLINAGLEWSRGYDLLQGAHTLAFESSDPRAISWATLTYGFCYHFPQGNFGEALRTLNEGIDFFRQLGWPMVLHQLIMNKAVVLAISGQLEASQRLIDETLVQAQRSGHTYVEKGLETLRFISYMESRQWTQSGAVLAKLTQSEIPAQFKPWFYRTRMLMNGFTGNIDQAQVDAEEMERSLAMNGAGMYAPECAVSLAMFHHMQGNSAEALACLDKNLELCSEARAKFWEMKTLMVRASVALEQSDWASLRLDLTQSLRLARSNHYADFWVADPWNIAAPLLLHAVAENLEKELAEMLLISMGERLTPSLESLLQHPETRMRRAALDYLERAGQPETRQQLLRALEGDPDEEVRTRAREALSSARTSGLEVRALGSLRMQRDGQTWELPRGTRPLTMRLLKFFVVHGTRLIACDRILDTFWPDAEPDKARHNLATHLSTLRKGMGDSNLFPRLGDSYRLSQPGEVMLDVSRFEELSVRGLERGRADAQELLEQAEVLYRGPLLEDDLYEEWVDVRRQELRALYERGQEALGDLYLEQRHYDLAIQRFRRLLSTDEPVEQVFPKLARCFEAMNDTPGIRREFEQLRNRLRENLGVEPQPATRALVESLLKTS